jgi:hypothetical protein
MRRLLTTRRREWLPGLALAGATLAIGVLIGATGGRDWPLALGLILGTLAGVAGAARYIEARRGRGSTPVARRFRLIPRRKAPYDLAKDDSTDDQRWLM